MLENSNENINANTKLTVCKNTYLKTITAFQHISVQTRGKAVLWAKDKAKRQNHKNHRQNLFKRGYTSCKG